MRALLFAAALIAAPHRAEDPAPPAPIQRLEAWPKVENATQVATDVERLRKARTEQMKSEATSALIAAGAGAAPSLLAALGKEGDAAAQARLVGVLEKLTGAEHTRLLAKDFESKSARLRRWVLLRVAAFPDAELKGAAEAAFARATASKDPDDVFASALCAASTGSFVGFDELSKSVTTRWKDSSLALRTALEGLRGPEATKRVLAMLKPSDRPAPKAPPITPEDRQRVVAALRLIAACGDASAKARTGAFLDSEDHSVRIAAINAVRALLDHAPAIDDLPVFEAIETAKKLKARL